MKYFSIFQAHELCSIPLDTTPSTVEAKTPDFSKLQALEEVNFPHEWYHPLFKPSKYQNYIVQTVKLISLVQSFLIPIKN
jgi:hypothetical protein